MKVKDVEDVSIFFDDLNYRGGMEKLDGREKQVLYQAVKELNPKIENAGSWEEFTSAMKDFVNTASELDGVKKLVRSDSYIQRYVTVGLSEESEENKPNDRKVRQLRNMIIEDNGTFLEQFRS